MASKEVSEIPGLNIEDLKLKGFRVHEMPASTSIPASRGRRDFYKIGLTSGNTAIEYGGKIIEANGTFLVFINPHSRHSVIKYYRKENSYACLFTEDFIAGLKRTELLQSSPLFNNREAPVIPLNDEQATFMTGIFQKMLAVHNGDYPYKGNLLRSCIELVIHEALRIQPPQNGLQFINAATRITHLFMDMLERQFPIERTGEPLRLRTAQDYAAGLSVHINYLNRSIKEVTGKPTSVHIAERIAAEAKALLQHTDWSVADIAYGLGFEYPTYFNNYFKRVTGATPKSFRVSKV